MVKANQLALDFEPDPPAERSTAAILSDFEELSREARGLREHIESTIPPPVEAPRRSRFEGWTREDYEANAERINRRGPRQTRKFSDPLAEAVGEMAPLFAETLVHHWSDAPLDFAAVRFLVIETLYSEICKERDMRWTPIEDLTNVGDAVRALRDHVRQLPLGQITPEQFGCAHEALSGYQLDGRRLVRGDGRSKGGVHFTPSYLASKVATRAIVPMMRLLREQHPEHSVLHLRVMDPACGAGSFLLATIRYLAPWVVKEGVATTIDQAKQLVARHVCLGLDIDPFAVHSARLAVQLECRADEEPPGWLDGCIRHGDALVGLSLDQVRAFHWAPKDASETASECVARMVDLRHRLDTAGIEQRQAIHWNYLRAKADVVMLADLCLGAFFSSDQAKAREAERLRRLALADRWWRALHDGAADFEAIEGELLAMRDSFRSERAPFHWDVEYLDEIGQERGDKCYANVFVGNPPFLGGKKVSSHYGNAYQAWLQVVHPGAHGNADLCAHFFRRAQTMLGNAYGTMGFIATNTISQGDTRATGLHYLVSNGMRIYDAHTSVPWPGSAKVTISTVHLMNEVAAFDEARSA